MKKLLIFFFIFSVKLYAQFNPPPVAAYQWNGTAWIAASSSASGGALSFNPAPAALYCYNSGLGQWVPADSSCLGGGGSGTVSGQASGVIPLGTSATVIGAQSHLDDGVTTASTITAKEPIQDCIGTPCLTWTATSPIESVNINWSNGYLGTLESINGQLEVDGNIIPTDALPANYVSTLSPDAGYTTFKGLHAGSGQWAVEGILPVASIVARGSSDLLCAHAADTTIEALTITNIVNAGGSSWTFTTSTSWTTATYQIGQTINVAGVTPSTLNGSYTINTTVSGTSFTATANSSQSGTYTSGGTMNMVCTNTSSDALSTSLQAFATTLTIPAVASYPTTYNLAAEMNYFTTATVPTITLPQPLWNSSTMAQVSGVGTQRASAIGQWASIGWTVDIPVSGFVNTFLDRQGFGASSPVGGGSGVTITPVTTSSSTISLKTGFAATGIASGTYTSGGSITGSATQTCTLSTFNNGNSGGTATVALTGTNTIAGGTALTITNTGFASTSAATTATLGNGTATCSGTATIATVLGGAQGNAIRLMLFRASQQF